MTTTSKQLRRKHRKTPKPQRQGHHPSRGSGLERLDRLKPAYIAWRTRTVPLGQARADWAGLFVMLESYAETALFTSPDAFDPQPFAAMLNSIRHLPGDAACKALNRLDGYLHFLQDIGHWRRGSEVFDVLHMLVLMRAPGLVHRRTLRECPIDIPARHGHGIPLVQWAAYLLEGMLEGKFSPETTEPLALPITDPAGPILLAPGLYPLPLSRFLNLFTAMHEAYLFDSGEDENPEDEDDEQDWGTKVEPYPTHSGMALLHDDHPQNHDAIRSLLTAFLRTMVLAVATPSQGLAGLRRADKLMAVLTDVATESSTSEPHGETSMLSLGEDIHDRLADRFGEISASILACLQAGVVEYAGGTLVAQSVVREAIMDLRDEYVG